MISSQPKHQKYSSLHPLDDMIDCEILVGLVNGDLAHRSKLVQTPNELILDSSGMTRYLNIFKNELYGESQI